MHPFWGLPGKGVFTTIDVPDAAATLGASDINARGDIVGNFLDAGDVVHGFLLSDGKFTQIDYPRASATAALDVNNAGDIAGSYLDAASHGFLLRDGQYTQIDVPGSVLTAALGINDDGVIVGRYEDRKGRTRGFKAKPRD